MNSFLQLHQEDTEVFVQKYQDDVRHKVESRIRTIHFISDVLEHFFPRLSDTVTVMMGGDVMDPEEVYLTIDEKDLPPKDPPAPGADGEEEIIR